MSSLFSLPPLGVGISLKEHYLYDISDYLSIIDCLEIKPDHYFKDKHAANLLAILNEKLPLIAHGLGLSIGSAEGISKRHLNKLKRFFSYAPPMPWMGEHLGCSRAGGVEIPHFINIPYTNDMLALLKDNIRTAHEQLPLPVVFENIPWEFSYPESSLSEPEFFKRLTAETGCGFLLDATNLFANCINFQWDIDHYLREFPLQHIIQIHFNGGHYDNNGRYIDSHSEPTPPEVWDIIKTVLKSGAPVKALILERDDETTLEEVSPELVKAKQLYKRYGA